MLKRGERAEPCYREEGARGFRWVLDLAKLDRHRRTRGRGDKKTKENTKQHKHKEKKRGRLLLEADWLNLLWISLTVLFSLACRADAAESPRRNCKLWDSSQHRKVSNCPSFFLSVSSFSRYSRLLKHQLTGFSLHQFSHVAMFCICA